MRANHLYVHVPFCARRCVYCDFSIAVRTRVPVDDYLRGITGEWDLRLRGRTLNLETLYVGGGTPSKLGSDGVRRLMDLVRSRATIRDQAEVTLEANPEDVSLESARAWKGSGINRVSLGVQSFDDAVLRWMHRTHDAPTAERAVHVIREAGIDNVSIDLIFAAPTTVTRSWTEDLRRAVDFGISHVSVYGLTVEAHTPLGRWVARSDVSEAPEDRFADEFLEAHDALSAAGYEHYEVSNYGRPGFHSRHNWAYWQRRPYEGLGPSAHAYDGVRRQWNVAPYQEWLTRIDSGRDPGLDSETLMPQQAAAEEVYLDLRTTSGVRLAGPEVAQVQPWLAAGWATLDSTCTLRLTPLGWLRLDALASALTLFRSRY